MWLLPWKGKKDKSGSPKNKRKGGNTPSVQLPSPRPTTKTFGVLLDAVPKAPGTKIPLIVEVLVKHLRESALDTEGIFRVPGSVAEINELIRCFDEGQQINLKQYDLHALAGLLKKFFRDLPSPLIVASLNAQIAALFRNGAHKGPIEEILARMRVTLFQLPTVNFESLKCLVNLLVDIYNHTSINKMSLSNLVTCIVPSLDCSPAIITYGIQHYDYFFKEMPTPQHSAPQVIRHSIIPGSLQGLDAMLATSPRHTIALPSPSSWFSPPPPNFSSLSSPQGSQDVRRSQSPQLHAPTARTSADTSSGSPPFSSSPLTSSLPNHSPTFVTSSASRKLSHSGGLIPPPPRSSSSPSRRSFLENRLSVALTSSHTSSSAQFSPRTSLSLQISASFPHNSSSSSPTFSSVPPTFSSVPPTQRVSPHTPNGLASSYGSDSYSHLPRRQPSDFEDFRPRASSYAPQPTFLFGSDTEDAEDAAGRPRSLTTKQDPQSTNRKSVKKDKDHLFDDERDRSRDRKSKERREKERRSRDRRKTYGKETAQKKIEELQMDIQRERERTELATARSVEMEAKLRKEEYHTNILKGEIERLKRRIRSHSKSSSVADDDDFDTSSSRFDSEFDSEFDGEHLEFEVSSSAPASNNMPRERSAGKLDVKIRMPFPY